MMVRSSSVGSVVE
uniref:Uncharacterized protein n=1 Tax=Arundo donax TaxID=35708 RepID=A0A0A9EX01_ARUDO